MLTYDDSLDDDHLLIDDVNGDCNVVVADDVVHSDEDVNEDSRPLPDVVDIETGYVRMGLEGEVPVGLELELAILLINIYY